MDDNRKSWWLISLALTVGLALFSACTGSDRTTVERSVSSEAPSSGSSEPSNRPPRSLEDASAQFNERWCVAVDTYVHAMKNGLPVDSRKFQELVRSANRFERLATDLDHARFAVTSRAVSRLAGPIRSFVDALSQHVVQPPTGLWSTMRDMAMEMRETAIAGNGPDRSGAVASTVSSLGTC